MLTHKSISVASNMAEHISLAVDPNEIPTKGLGVITAAIFLSGKLDIPFSSRDVTHHII